MKNKMKWVMVLALVCFGSIMLYADCRNCGARFTKTFPCNKCGEWPWKGSPCGLLSK